jgi:hypothetical protein
VIISVLVAALAFLASFIITLNFYTTAKAFAHQTSTRSDAFFWGFLVAGVVSAIALVLSLYLTLMKRRPQRESTSRG